jgi:hypothetical protein
MRIFLTSLFLIIASNLIAQKHTISGYVHEKGSMETMIGVNVYLPDKLVGTTTNSYGFYTLTIPAQDSVELRWSFVGFKPVTHRISLRKDQQIDIILEQDAVLEEVVVSATAIVKESDKTQMSTVSITPIEIKRIPMLLGEKDVFKALQLMPGIQKGNEGSSGIYVRGGGPDQNLIILDEATVYNANHLFGFFSLFNGDALKSIELTKGGFPARYGGRLSSVIEMTMKDGNKETFGGEAGIGLISSRLLLEGPIIKGKSSFIISGRRTYIDILSQPLIRSFSDGVSAGYYFYDLNAKANYSFSNKNKLYVSGYFGRDKFYANSSENESVQKNGLYWQNATTTVRWNHLFNNQIFANTSAIFSDYTLKLYSEEKFAGDVYTMSYKSGIQDFTGKFDLQYIPNPNHLLRAGLSTIYHVFTPSAFVVKSVYNDDIDRNIKNEALESGLYLEDDWKTPWKLKVNGGIRLSSFVTGTKTYVNPEPRISASYPLKNNLSIKASFASMSQYLHLLSNTGVGLPTDLWVPATQNIAPQQSWQIAGGLAKDFSKKDISVTLEGYYKKSEHIIGYREGASFLMIDNPSSTEEFDWEKNVTTGQAWSYGGELMVRKNAGKLTGWIGYTLSWTQMQFDELNFGKKFYARYDRRHDISVVAMYNFTPDITMSATWVYGTGNAITLPKASYMPTPYVGNNYYFGTITDYGDKNSYRMAAYHRLDIGVQFHKKRTKYDRTIEFGLYNAYNRKNPFYIYLTSKYYDNGTQKQILKQVSIFPLIPSISWSIKF